MTSTSQDQPTPRRQPPAALRLLLAMLLVAIFTISLSREIFAPHGNDHANLQFFTDRIMAGQRMYADLLEHNGPGIIAIHYAATRLFGREPMDLRLFDACWQAVTLLALITLVGRDRGRWATGLLAAILYALAFYGYGHTNTAEREGFAVLLLLLAAHALLPGHDAHNNCRAPGRWTSALGPGLAGILGLMVFAIKPPLGLCFGALWCYELLKAWRDRRDGIRAGARLASLTVGFCAAAATSILILRRLDWWDAYVPVLTGRVFPHGYIQGPWKIRLLLPFLATAIAGSAVVLAILARRRGRTLTRHNLAPLAHHLLVVAILAGAMLTVSLWTGWDLLALRIVGLALPALVAVAARPWHRRSETWRISLLLGSAALAALFLQGRFTPYRFAPFMAFAAVLAAGEIAGRLRRLRLDARTPAIWTAACIAGMFHLASVHWWQQMVMYSSSPYVLAGTTLEDHYARLIRAGRVNVDYAVTREVAGIVRGRTRPDEPIALLFYEPHLSYLCRRPPVHRLIETADFHRALFPEFMEAIERRRPGVVIARLRPGLGPQLSLAAASDRTPLEAQLFDDITARFGPCGEVIRRCYRVAEIHGELAILEPIEPSPDRNAAEFAASEATPGHTSVR